MDPKLFQQRLKEFADLQDIKVSNTGLRESQIQPGDIELQRQGKLVKIYKDDNPTLGKEVAELKPRQQQCQDCNKTVINRTVTRTIYHTPVPHWRTKCLACKMYKNPRTGNFDLDTRSATNAYVTYHVKKDK